MPGQERGLVFWNEGVAVGDLDELTVWEGIGEPTAVLGRHDAVFGGPGDEHRSIEVGEVICRRQQVAFAGRRVTCVLAVVAPDLPVAQRLEPCPHDVVGQAPLRHIAQEHRELPYPPPEEHSAGRGDSTWHAGGESGEASWKTGRVVLEGFAGHEHEPPHPVHAPVGDHHLSTAPVVEAERHVVELETLHEFGQDPPEASEREVGIGSHRPVVGAHRERWQDATMIRPQVRDDVAPLGTVHQQPVHEDHDGPGPPGVRVLDRARADLNLRPQAVWIDHSSKSTLVSVRAQPRKEAEVATDTRERILDASCTLFQRQGYAATGIKQILAQADAAFASLYHFFPGGKDQLTGEAIRRSGRMYQALVEGVLDAAPDLVTGVSDCFVAAAETLRLTDYADACPIATVALEVASSNETLRQATADVFAEWITALTERVVAAGADEAAATEFAISAIALLEGAFMLSRAMRSIEPMKAAGAVATEAARVALATRPASRRH
jgi:AcrR family transcriptional regulator